ncbi:hypothetical protein ACW7BJ_20925 [Azospirillum argentinense]
MLDADEWHIRKLLKDGELQGHRLGKRGVRILVSSIEDYRNRNRIVPTAPAPRQRKQVPPSKEHLEAIATLQEWGILPRSR